MSFPGGFPDAASFRNLPPREQAALLRALLHLGQPGAVVALVPEGATSPALLDLRADALLRLGWGSEALATVARREAGQASSVSLGLRTRALARLGRVHDALAALDAETELPPYLRNVLRGEALLDAGDAAGARAAFEAAVTEHPYRRRGLLGLVRACAAQREWVVGAAFAARLLDTTGEEGPLSPEYLEALRDFHAAAGESQRAEEIAARLAERRREERAALEAQLGQAAPPEAAPAAPRPPPAQAAPPAPAAEAAPAAPPLPPEELRQVEALVRRHLGFPSLREGQAETMARVLRGEDVLAVLPTGGGKSICYQLPAVLSKGTTLVVSPLIALMKDQLDSLPPAMRAASVALTSELSPAQARRALDEVAEGRYRLVYAAPERLRHPVLLSALRRAGVARLVVDEAHCVSVWGHDFRPDYLGIADARRALGDPPVLAVTATAPPRVERDIQQRLGPLVAVKASVARPNLRLEAVVAKDADEKLSHLLSLCRETQGPGIVYASSRAKCEQLAAALQRGGILADAYHAGFGDRSERQEAFMDGKVDVLVATVAFGMGIDKGDIRYVFHHDPSTSLENYSQEAGRAGRDGQPARCVLLATPQDGSLLKQRARADLPSRGLIQAVADRLRPDESGHVVLDPDELNALDPDDVKPRVALSILVEAGAVERLPDVPRLIRVRGGGARFAAFEGRDASVFELADALGMAPGDVEPFLLAEEAQGRLFFQVSGRAHLLRAKGDLSRVPAVLDRYAALAEQRAKEIMDYAKATTCRHQYLRRYFGEDAPPRCDNCDLCLGIAHETAAADGGDDEATRRVILESLAGYRGLGERNLLWLLRGDPRASDWLTGKPGWGALGFRSESALKRLVQELEREGHLARETLEHGGVTLRVSDKGREALGGAAPLVLSTPARKPERPPLGALAADDGAARGGAAAPAEDEPVPPEAQPLFDALKAWRREKANEVGLPPYVVAHDRTLKEIALARPATKEALLKVKGMGPKKVETYGDDILAVLSAPAA